MAKHHRKAKRSGIKKLVDKEIKKELHKEVELKQIVYAAGSGASQAFNQTGPSVYITPAITEGTDQGQRVGVKVLCKQIHARGILQCGLATAPAVARIILFRDLQCNGAVPPIATVLADTAATSIVNSPFNIDYVARYKVLYDKMFQLNNQGGATDQREMIKWSFKKHYKTGVPFRYSGTTGAIANAQAGQVFGLFLTDAAASAPFTWFSIEYKYTDE